MVNDARPQPFQVPWSDGQLLLTKDLHVELWDRDKKLGDLELFTPVVYLGESKISKRKQRTMIRVLTKKGTGWLDARQVVPNT